MSRPRNKLFLLLALAAGSLACLLAVPRIEVEFYSRHIDDEPMFASTGLRRLGEAALLPLAREVADRFDARPILAADRRRFLILEGLIQDNPQAGLALARDPRLPDPLRRMLGTLTACLLSREEQWELAAYWAARESPWTREVLYSLGTVSAPELRADAVSRLESTRPGERLAAGLALMSTGECKGDHEAVRWVCQNTKRVDWYQWAIRCLLQDMESEDLPLLADAMLSNDESLRREVLWALRFHKLGERVPMLLGVVEATSGEFRRDCFTLVAQTLGTELKAAEHMPPATRERITPYLRDADAAVRAAALKLLYPNRTADAETLRQVTADLSAPELIDHGLYEFLERPRQIEVAKELIVDVSELGEQRIRAALLRVFPPFDADDLLSVLDVTERENAGVVHEALQRLPSLELLPIAGALVDRLAARPDHIVRSAMQLLASRRLLAELDAEHRRKLERLLHDRVDPHLAAGASIYVDDSQRRAAAALAVALGGKAGRQALIALESISRGAERTEYEKLRAQIEAE